MQGASTGFYRGTVPTNLFSKWFPPTKKDKQILVSKDLFEEQVNDFNSHDHKPDIPTNIMWRPKCPQPTLKNSQGPKPKNIMTTSLPQTFIHPTYTLPPPQKKQPIGESVGGSLITLGRVLGKVKTSSKKSRFTGEGPDEMSFVGIHGGMMAIDNGGKTGRNPPTGGFRGKCSWNGESSVTCDRFLSCFFIMGMGILCEKSSRIDAWKFISNL